MRDRETISPWASFTRRRGDRAWDPLPRASPATTRSATAPELVTAEQHRDACEGNRVDEGALPTSPDGIHSFIVRESLRASSPGSIVVPAVLVASPFSS